MPLSPEQVIEEIERSAVGEATATKLKQWIVGLAMAMCADKPDDDEPCERGAARAESVGDSIGAQIHAHRADMIAAARADQVDSFARAMNRTRGDRDHYRAAFEDERKRHGVTQAQLDKFMSACADQTIQIMELRGEILRLRDSDRDGEALTAARAKIAYLEARSRLPSAVSVSPEEDRLRASIASLRNQIDRLREPLGLGSACEVGRVIGDAIEAINAPCPDCKAMGEEIDNLKAGLMTADADRVPLRMDLDEANKEIERGKPVFEAVKAFEALWQHGKSLTDPGVERAAFDVTQAFLAYEKACKAAEDDIPF